MMPILAFGILHHHIWVVDPIAKTCHGRPKEADSRNPTRRLLECLSEGCLGAHELQGNKDVKT